MMCDKSHWVEKSFDLDVLKDIAFTLREAHELRLMELEQRMPADIEVFVKKGEERRKSYGIT